MSKIFPLFSFLLLYASIWAQAETVWTLVENTKVYQEKHCKEKNYAFTATKGVKVVSLARFGKNNYQVKFQDGQIGWVEFHSFQEGRKLIANQPIGIYSGPDPKGTPKEKFQPGDTLYFLSTNGSGDMIKVNSSHNKNAWILDGIAYPLVYGQVPSRETSPFFYEEAKLGEIIKGKNITEALNLWGEPESQILSKEGIYNTYYPNITVLKGEFHHQGLYLQHKNGLIVGDSLSYKGEKMWIESLPLVGFVRKFSFVNLLAKPTQKELKPISAIEKKQSWWLNALFFVLKLAAIVGFLSLPIVIARFVLKGFLYIRFIPNTGLKILNYLLFFFVAYLFYLFILINIGFASPLFMTIISVLVLYFFLRRYPIHEFNYENIDKRRCLHCHHLDSLEYIESELISKKHETSYNFWKTFSHSTTDHVRVDYVDVTVHTDHYNTHSSAHPVTVFVYHDHYACNRCNEMEYLPRTERKYGHI